MEYAIDSIISSNGGDYVTWFLLTELISKDSDNAIIFASKTKNLLKQRTSLLLLLNIIDFVVESSTKKLLLEISNKDYLSEIISLTHPGNPPDIVNKGLSLIKKWGIRFTTSKDELRQFHELYFSMLADGVNFPDSDTNKYDKYIIPDFEEENKKYESQHKNSKINLPKENNDEPIKLDLDSNNYPKKYSEHILHLNQLWNLITLANEMIDNKEEWFNGLDEMIGSIRDINEIVEKKIRSDDSIEEKVLGLTMGIQEDAAQTTRRFEDYINKKISRKYESCFMKEYKGYNLSKNHFKMPVDVPAEVPAGVPFEEYDFISVEYPINLEVEKNINQQAHLAECLFNFCGNKVEFKKK